MRRRLYHYTCSHGRDAIGEMGVLIPNRHPFLKRSFVWLTDMEVPDRDALGLTSTILSCDRLEYSYEVIEESIKQCMPFSRFKKLSNTVVEDLARYAQPSHWWVSTRPITAVLSASL